MDEDMKRQQIKTLALQLADSLEDLSDALVVLSLSLEDSQMHLDPESARAAEAIVSKTLRDCARPTPQPPYN